MTGILSRKASARFSGSSDPPAGRRQFSPSDYSGMMRGRFAPGIECSPGSA